MHGVPKVKAKAKQKQQPRRDSVGEEEEPADINHDGEADDDEKVGENKGK